MYGNSEILGYLIVWSRNKTDFSRFDILLCWRSNKEMVMKSPLRNVILLLMVLLFGFNQPAKAQTPDAGELLRVVQARYTSLQSYYATGEVLSGVKRDRSASIFHTNQSQEMRSTFTIKLARPQMYKIIWEQGNSFFSSKGAVWSDGESRYVTMGGQISAKNLLLWKGSNPCG